MEANPAFTSATSLTGIRIHNATFTVGGGAEDFTDLDDTPSALGVANAHVRVNAAGDALEFGLIPTTAANPVVAGVQLQQVANVNLTTTWATWSNFTNAHFGINRGGFTLAQQSNRELIVVPEAGIYVFYVNTNIGDADDGDREAISLRARVVRGGTPLTSVPISRNYYRGLSDITDYSLTVGALFDLQVGDQVGFELKTESAAIDGVTINTTGSYMSLIKIQGRAASLWSWPSTARLRNRQPRLPAISPPLMVQSRFTLLAGMTNQARARTRSGLRSSISIA